MHVKQFQGAKSYNASNHWGVAGLRLEGFEPGCPANQWIRCSQFLPGGEVGSNPAPFGKENVVLNGQVTLEWDGQTSVSGPMGSRNIPPKQIRRIKNKSNHVCKMLVVVPCPVGVKP